MKSIKQRDETIEITFKNGNKVVYNSLEDASVGTNLSPAALKIRANKSRNGSAGKKDGINARWVSDITFRSYQAKKSKNKGSAFEGEIVHKLQELGFDVCRSASESKKLDANKVDIAGDCPFAIQAKHTQNLPNYFTIRDACTDSRPLALLWKKVGDVNSISPGTLAIIPVEYFYKLIELIK